MWCCGIDIIGQTLKRGEVLRNFAKGLKMKKTEEGNLEYPDFLNCHWQGKECYISETITQEGGERILFRASECYVADGIACAESVAAEMVRCYNLIRSIRDGPQLWQLHHQFKDRTEMVAQRPICSEIEMREWQRDVSARHPLPEGAAWMVCNDKSKHFVWAVPHQEKPIDGLVGTDVEVV